MNDILTSDVSKIDNMIVWEHTLIQLAESLALITLVSIALGFVIYKLIKMASK